MPGGAANLMRWLGRADQIDWDEGAQAYPRYRQVMQVFADRFAVPLDRVTAAFVALSPNTDYLSNLRSLVSVLDGVTRGVDPQTIVVSTYNHNRDRAINYVTGAAPFVAPTRGRKILSFYDNILFPETSNRVTVDGHMVAIWRDQELTMKEATVRPGEYNQIEGEVRRIAFYHHVRPCEIQAILWFARKRYFKIKFNGQLDLFDDPDDKWGTLSLARDLQPYGSKE